MRIPQSQTGQVFDGMPGCVRSPWPSARDDATSSNIEFSEKLKELKLLNVPAADNTVRLAPPLIVSHKEIDKSIIIIKKALKELK